MYIILELQTNGDQTAALVHTAADRQQAESIYHQVLAAAAISPVEIHSAALLTEYGYLLQRDAYEHKAQEEETPEEEVE